MSGLFVTALGSRRLDYYFGSVAGGREDFRTSLQPDDVEGFGTWRSHNSDSMQSVKEELRYIERDARFIRRISNIGYDLCFVAPKQISVLFALLPSQLSYDVLESHKASVRQTLRSVEGEICWGSRSELDGIAFLHQTSRSLDPHLHTHLLIANRSSVSSQMYRAIDSTRLFAEVSAISKHYRTSLAKEIYSRLGIIMIESERSIGNGPTEVPGFPAEISRLFSKRSREVAALTHSWGTNGLVAARSASLITRHRKEYFDAADLKVRWKEELTSVGLHVGLLNGVVPRNPYRVARTLFRDPPIPAKAAVADFFERVELPAPSEGEVTFMRYDRDIFQRLKAFSMAPIVGVIYGTKFAAQPHKALDVHVGLADTVEVVVAGKFASEVVANVASRFRHQKLLFVVEARCQVPPDVEARSAWKTLSDFDTNNQTLRSGHHLPERAAGSSIEAPRADHLSSALGSIAEEAKSFSCKSLPARYLMLGSRTDRDLARAEIAKCLGRQLYDCGFYEGEPIWVKYLPRRFGSVSPRPGRIWRDGTVVEFFEGGIKRDVPMSEVKLGSMIIPLQALSMGDSRRIFGGESVVALGLGEFAVRDVQQKSMSLFLHPENGRLLAERRSLVRGLDDFGIERVASLTASEF